VSSIEHQVSSFQSRVIGNRMVLGIVLVFLIIFLSGFNSVAALSKENLAVFRETVEKLTSFGDRSTGSSGNQKAAAYIKERFSALGFETVGSHQFDVAIVKHKNSTLTMPDRNLSIPIRPIRGNAVSPQTIPPSGIQAPLIYVGSGDFHELNGKEIEGSVILMELESGKNWLYAADLGAKALIYLDRGNSPKILFEEKFEFSPVQFPRFWMALDEVQEIFHDFEAKPAGRLADQVHLSSDINWDKVISENIYVIISGTDPELKEQSVLVEAFYDSTDWVAGRSPGADEACSIATLLSLAQYLKENPPQRTVILAATSGHAQALAGMRELMWSLTTRSKIQRQMKRDLKALIKKTRNTIKALENASFESLGTEDPADEERRLLAKHALEEQIKTVSDSVSRRLMQLRLQEKTANNLSEINKLANERQLLRQLVWKPTFTDLTSQEQQALTRLVPQALREQRAVLSDARTQLKLLDSARTFRGQAKVYDLVATVSLHLSSHGDGFGAFNYGWQYPFRPRINRTAAYSLLDEILRQGAADAEQSIGISGVYKDTLRPSGRRTWQSYFLDRPPLGGEVTALAGFHGLTFVTTNDARAAWGTPSDTFESVDFQFAHRQSAIVAGLIEHLTRAPRLHDGILPRNGIGEINGNAKFLRHGELFADQPAPGTVLLCYQGPARYYVIVDHMGRFHLRGLADKKHSYHKVIFEGYKFDEESGAVNWTIDKKQTGKNSYRVKMFRRHMETDLIMFASKGITLFNLLEPRTFRYLHKGKIIDGRRETDPLHYFYSRLDTWISFYRNASSITTVFLEAGTPLKMTLSDSVLRKKMILLNGSENNPQGNGYMVEKWPIIHRTEYQVARDMWTLLTPRITNLEKRGIFNERIRNLQMAGQEALSRAETALQNKQYGQFFEATARSWALSSRVYDDVETTQKDVLYGVLFYIALFVPFAFCLERLLFSYSNIYKRIIAFSGILILLIILIYNIHPAFRLAYSPMIVILAFFIMGLSLIVTLIIFFRFEEEMTRLQTHAQLVQSGELGRWKAFVAAFLLGVSNLRRRRLRTALTCATLIILTFTIMSFTSAKSMRRHARVLYDSKTPYQGFLLKNVNWRSLPPEAFGRIANSFGGQAVAVPRVWLEDEDRTRTTRIPVHFEGHVFEAQGMVGLSADESQVSGLDDILVAGRWLLPDERQAVLLPERMAEQLKIDFSRAQNHSVSVWGMPFQVVGIFSGKRLQESVDLDGEPLTPVTFPREMSSELSEVEEEAMESGDDVREFQSRYQHVAGDLTLIVPYRFLLAAGGHLKAVAIRPESRKSIQTAAQTLNDRFGLSLFSGEPDGTYLYNASDTMSYSGVPNIIIPLIISIFIVLNTMIGSVYERKREIGIYTSVGLAPSHVSFLFIAEAMAFAVLSVVFGYLLAQTTAKLFAETSLWSGITVNYSSMSGVAAMILVIVVVLISVIYPSKVAGQIAMPDINRSWTLPPAKGNELELTLPFLMTYREHRSIGGFLYEYFEGHQEISHGMFSTNNIEFGSVCETPPGLTKDRHDCAEDACECDQCLQIKARVWLAPFDFGIMQRVALEFRPAETESGFLEIHVRLNRASGEANAWHRINKAFLHDIRKQLLIWRSFDDETKLQYEQLLISAEKELGMRRA
ncbi:MAG: M28 family peptidase, partial [Deltaproteobacteria bacterium]|nr:M28 family peptidase [Deltaproteobacteria bacterium]